MDGSKSKLINSLQFRLSVALAIVIAIVAAIGGTVGYQSAFKDANELQDDQLREVAAMVDAKRLDLGQVDPIVRVGVIDKESHVALQVLGGTGEYNKTSTEPGVAFPDNLPDGMQTVRSGKKWRVFVTTLKSGQRIAVAQRTALRNEIARHAAVRTVLPIVLLIPFLIALSIVLLRILLAPINKLAREIDARTLTDTTPLSAHGLPSEIKPFVASINQMLGRLESGMEQQRRFVADAAHELRSPLTALSLQTENLASHALPAETRPQLEAMQAGLLRARTLVSQLLSLARAQLATVGEKPGETGNIELQGVIRDVFEEILPLAEAKGVDLGVTQTCAVHVKADPVELNTVVRNLIDNAIRYSGHGGRVDVTMSTVERRAIIEVQDNGPGIPESERSKVFEPFYRLNVSQESGSGLGLSIVKNILVKLAGDASIRSAPAGGTVVRVSLPQVT